MAVSHTKPRVWIKAAIAAGAICLLIFGSVRYYNAQMEAEIAFFLRCGNDFGTNGECSSRIVVESRYS